MRPPKAVFFWTIGALATAIALSPAPAQTSSGRAVLDRLLVEVKEHGVSENQNPDVQGNRMSIVIAPNK